MPDQPNATGGANPNGNGAETPEYVTKDDFTAALNVAVNAAVTNHMKRALSKDVPAAVKTAFKEELPTVLTETLAPMLKEHTGAAIQEHLKATQQQAEADKAKTSKGAPEEPKPDPKVLQLEDQVKKLTDALAKQQKITEEEKRIAAEQTRAANDRKAYSDLSAVLAQKVRPEAVDIAATTLKARGHLITDTDGNPRLKFKGVFEKHGMEEERELELKAGIDHYLKSEEAKLFLPAPTTGGAGGTGAVRRPGTGPAAGTTAPNGQRVAGTDPVESFEQRFGSIETHI